MGYKHENIPKIILCCMGLYSFLINTGSGYFDDHENSQPESAPEESEGVGEDEDQDDSSTRGVFLQYVQGHEFNAIVQRVTARRAEVAS